jgi:hypothetical protein
MCDPIDPVVLAAKATGEAVEKVLESEPVNNLLAPVTKELGLTIGEVANVFRFYVTENLKSVFKKWAQQRNGNSINAVEFQLVLPLLQSASLQSDEELQERWAALLESTVTHKENVLPSFGSTLSQLTAEEARYLDKLWSAVIRRNPLPNEPYRLKRNQFDFNFMQFVFDPELSEDAGKYKTKRFFKEQPSAKEIEAFGRQDKLRLMVQDLERLGIIGSRSELHQGQSDWVEVESKEIEIPGDSVLHQWTSFTPYGKSFINAVKPKITSGK